MTADNKDVDDGTHDDSSTAIASAVEDTRKKVMSTLLPSIDKHVTSESFDHQKDGLDFLEVKNSLMLSYLIDLTQLIRVQSSPSTDGDNDDDDTCLKPCLDRLRTMKVALDKMRPMEKKLRYSLDKLLALSATSSTFAAGEEITVAREQEPADNNEQSDPLLFRPNPDRLVGNGDSDGDGDGDTSSSDADDASDTDDRKSIHSNSEDSADDDDELKAAKTALDVGRSKSAKKRRDTTESTNPRDPSASSSKEQLYRAPRLVAVPFAEREKQAEREEHLRKKERNRMLKSELLSTLRSSYGDAPEEEDYEGGATLGKQREAAQRLADRDKEKTEFEEGTMMRLTTSRKEKKMRNKVMRDEISNLNAIADLSNLTAGVSAAFGDGARDDNARGRFAGDEDTSSRHDNGKRRRMDGFGEEYGTGQQQGAQKRKTRPNTKNSFQKALYGMDDGGGGGGGGKKNSKKSKRKN